MSIWNASIELANKVYTLAYVALVLGAILTAVSTMSLFWASALRDKDADTQIQTAKREAAQATENASVARTAAVLATERGNALAVEAEQARVEQERLKIALEEEQVERLRFQSEFAWRALTDEQRQLLIAALSAQKGAVRIEFVSNDPEATFVAIQFEKIFRTAGWDITTSANTYAGSVMLGLMVPNAPGPATDLVRRALSQAQIGFRTEDPPVSSMAFGNSPPTTEFARLVIGSKPTPNILNALQSLPQEDVRSPQGAPAQ